MNLKDDSPMYLLKSIIKIYCDLPIYSISNICLYMVSYTESSYVACQALEFATYAKHCDKERLNLRFS